MIRGLNRCCSSQRLLACVIKLHVNKLRSSHPIFVRTTSAIASNGGPSLQGIGKPMKAEGPCPPMAAAARKSHTKLGFDPGELASIAPCPVTRRPGPCIRNVHGGSASRHHAADRRRRASGAEEEGCTRGRCPAAAHEEGHRSQEGAGEPRRGAVSMGHGGKGPCRATMHGHMDCEGEPAGTHCRGEGEKARPSMQCNARMVFVFCSRDQHEGQE